MSLYVILLAKKQNEYFIQQLTFHCDSFHFLISAHIWLWNGISVAHDSAKCRAQAVGFSDTLEHFFSDHFRNAEWFFFFWVFSCISKLDWFLPHFQNITQRTWGGLLVAVNFQMSLFPQSIFRIIKLFCFYDPTKEQSEQAHFTDGNTERSLTWSKLQSGQGRKMTARSSVC